MRTLLLTILIAGAVSAQTGTETRLAARGLAEFARVCEADGLLLWRKSLCGRIVLADPPTRAAVTNAPDPDGQFRKEGDVFLGVFPKQFTPSNTSIEWGGQEWSTVTLPLPTDPFQRLSLLAHESFHRIQSGLHLGASDEPNPYLDTQAGRIWLRLELRALARALRSSGPDARQSAADALVFRFYRRRLCPGSEPLEAALEKQEGLAEYTGDFVALRATGEDIGRVARAVEAFEDGNAFARSFAYATGPALGLLLDRYAVGWRERAVSASLDSLLARALRIDAPQDLQRQADQRAFRYGSIAIVAAEREREERRQTFLADLKSRFLEGPTLDFPSAPEMRRNFNPQTLVPFPPYGTFYPSGTFSANWGKLEVESGGALLAPDNRSVRVPAPQNADQRPLRGPGWLLELEPGWTIRPGEKTGAFVVAPGETK